ncbi:putative Minor capsid protein [Carnobacterium maltaromaticum]|jgi:hypothetical protein|uniref:minor capsid protein n=1 Tax=Carnobacterium maltaromaticum TaxID=2751 RepID=UPI00026C87CE|nr:minor capsid protein [Carnobacterium maltaromaticum]KRN71365.1 hypothetical protein IV76_GL000865 [Carnobacterium maltaromaticum]CRH18733.1 putative Minor capsid protein [Carnobacterium maltaromaticum]
MGVRVEFSGVYSRLDRRAMDRGKYALANQMLADMTPFIPADNYIMRQTGNVTNQGDNLEWNTPYAKPQFYGTNGKVTFKNYTTPGTGSRWDLKAKSLFMNSWVRAFTEGAGL